MGWQGKVAIVLVVVFAPADTRITTIGDVRSADNVRQEHLTISRSDHNREDGGLESTFLTKFFKLSPIFTICKQARLQSDSGGAAVVDWSRREKAQPPPTASGRKAGIWMAA